MSLRFVTTHATYDVIDGSYNGRPSRVLYSAEGHTAQSGIARDGLAEQLFDYIERFLELVRYLKPARVLLIGGGAFVLPRAIIEEFPDTFLTVVEIDELLPTIARKHFGFQPSERTQVVLDDGLQFLTEDAGEYDLIIQDIYNDEMIPSGFQTEQTARLYREHLALKGTLACNIIASYQGQYSWALRRQIAALQPVFKRLQLFPAGYDESGWLPQNFILTAQLRPKKLHKALRYAPLALP